MKDFNCYNHGTGVINLTNINKGFTKVIAQLKPTELHLKEDGAKNNTASVAIVMVDSSELNAVVGQISIEMLNEGLKDIGYELKKI